MFKKFMKESKGNIKFIDFCAGIGGGRLGLEQNGFKCVGFSEINDNSINTYRRFFGNEEINYGDLTKISIKELPDFDLLIAGFPCQSFSINGKRKAFDDERGQIIFFLSQILDNKKIKYFILENVKGLVNINKGETLKQILKLLDEVGYNVSYKVLNSLDYGLPQSRERIYFVGIRKDLRNNKYLFPQKIKQNFKLKDFFIEESDDYVIKRDSQRWNTLIKQMNNKYNKDKFSIDELLKREFLVIDTRQSDIRLYENYIPTLRTGRSGICYIKDGKLRKLSGKESLLFQGFSKKHIKCVDSVSDMKLLEQTGNAMSVSAIYHIASQFCNIINLNEEL